MTDEEEYNYTIVPDILFYKTSKLVFGAELKKWTLSKSSWMSPKDVKYLLKIAEELIKQERIYSDTCKELINLSSIAKTLMKTYINNIDLIT